MKIEGAYKVPGARELVYKQLLDPEVLVHALPGCEELVPNPDGSYQTRMKVGIAAIKGTYQGRVEILDANPPAGFRMRVNAQGKGGFLKGEGEITLTTLEAETSVSYSGETQVGGMIASVGQRMIQAATRKIVDQFFQAFSRQFQQTSVS
ncbi:MAG: carbon monoxide dehydrogenase subunit G [Acidobacteriota bacterium]